MRTRLKLPLLPLFCLSLLLAACASKHGKPGTPDNEPTLKSLSGRTLSVAPDQGVNVDEAQAIDAYKSFLQVAPNAPQRAQAMRRIGDLEMDHADVVSADPQASSDPDFSAAIRSYQTYLHTYPADPGNDQVLYQLARAQEQGGNLDAALGTLNALVSQFPDSSSGVEAQFRRGELLFAARDYHKAETAYATVLAVGKQGRYYDRALYMRGWSQFKLGQLEDGLHSFLGVLDLKVAGRDGDASLESIAGLSRADRELVEDTFRVTSLSLANLQGAESIAAYMTTPERLSYEFRVYQQLGELYLKQERIKDAADTFSLFARQKPLDAQAPVLQARVIDTYADNGFATLALEATKEYVQRYGRSSEFRTTNPQGWDKAQPLVKIHLAELAQHYHASAQKSKQSADYQQAIYWYREYLASFPTDPAAAQTNFLLAELLFEDQHFAEARIEYEKTAYDYPLHASSADAAYAALLSYAKQNVDATELPALQQSSVASALRFANTFKGDVRAAPVLANAAEKLFNLKDPVQAAVVAQSVLDLQPPAQAEQRRIAWSVLAYTSFDQGSYAAAEQAFAQVLNLTGATSANATVRSDLIERQAAAIYRQGEQARNDGQLDAAVAHFDRIAQVAPDSPVRANAQYDAAAALIALKQWDRAASALEDFRRRYPKHALQPEVSNKLAAVYLEQGHWSNAALELEHLAAASSDSKTASAMLWQAAGLYRQAGALPAAAKTYENFLTKNSQLLEPAIEARYQLALIAHESANPTRELALMKEIVQADRNGGSARTERSRYLGATAALALAEPVLQGYRKITLVEPLKKNLKLKKARMEEALKAYAQVTDYGVADVSTAATFQIAGIYRDFGHALMTSERPGKLSKIELEQYNVLLEEQAFPFEEKAIEVHQINTRLAARGIYDQWVKNSFAALRELQPVRYGKTEKPDAAALTPGQPESLNQQGITLRQQGQFDKAGAAYQQAIEQDANNAEATLNLGILYDLYLGNNSRALELYQRYLTLKPESSADVKKWVAELSNRKPLPEKP